MEWTLGFDWRALGDPVSEGRRVWEWIQRARPLHPSLDLWRPTANIFAPGFIGALTREDIPLSPTPEPFRYLPGWKMFFASDSPHYQRATQLATTTAPVANGAIFTFGTPDTYPTILNQW